MAVGPFERERVPLALGVKAAAHILECDDVASPREELGGADQRDAELVIRRPLQKTGNVALRLPSRR